MCFSALEGKKIKLSGEIMPNYDSIVDLILFPGGKCCFWTQRAKLNRTAGTLVLHLHARDHWVAVDAQACKTPLWQLRELQFKVPLDS